MQVVVVVVLFVAFLKKTSDCKFNIVNWIKGQSLMINAVSIHLKIISEVRIVLFIPNQLNRNKDAQGSDTMSQSGKFTNAYRCNGCLSKDVLRCCRTSIGVEKYIEDILKTFGSIETPFTVSQLHVLQKLF